MRDRMPGVFEDESNGEDGSEAEGQPTLLLIEDDSMVGRFIAHAGEECGYRAIRTMRFERFASAFAERAPDAIAVDLCVPGADGVEVIRFLAAKQFKGPVLIISGLDPRVVASAMRLGQALGLAMAEPLHKPFRVDELARRLDVRLSVERL